MSDLFALPPMEPRGRYRPRPGIVRTAEMILGCGFVGTLLKLLDAFGRGESAMDVYKLLPRFLGFVASPIFSVCLMVAGFLLLWRFAKSSEIISPSQIIHPITKQPFVRPIYPAFRRAAWTFVVALLVATALWGCYGTPLRSFLFIEPLPFTVALPMPLGPHNVTVRDKSASIPPTLVIADHVPTQANNPSPDLTPTATAPIPPLIIPAPSQPTTMPPAENKASSQPTVSIGGKFLKASDKAPGTLYISVKLAEVSRYRGTFDDKTVDAVKTALEQTKKISVFTGGYDVGASDRRYGIGAIAPAKARNIYYFDKTLDNACAAIQRIKSDVIRMPMVCQFYQAPAPSPDPNDLNLLQDFWLASGLDMEVWL